MRFLTFPVFAALIPGVLLGLLAAPQAAVACTPMRVGYMDQERPPYFLGNGAEVPNPPGASVDLMQDAVLGAGFGCAPTWVRLPIARLNVALTNGEIDMTPVGELASYPPEMALPRDKDGNIDRDRALQNILVVLVRASDRLPANTNPMQYFRDKVLGIPQGHTSTARLREAGLTIDDGGRDLERNIEKLKLGRIDGIVVSSVHPEDVKATLTRYKGSVVLLPQPLSNTRVWLAFNQTYYRAHADKAEAVWIWLDNNRSRIHYVIQKYRKQE